MGQFLTASRKLQRAIALAATSLTAASLIVFGPPSPAFANVTAVTLSPATWTPGSSQAFTLTLQVSGSLNYSAFWALNRQTWTLSQTGSYDGTFDEGTDTLTCATTGITYTSALYDGWGSGVKTRACLDDQDSNYFEIGMNNPNVTGTGTVVVSVPAGLLTAPSILGTTVFQTVTYSTFDFNAVVAEAAPVEVGPRQVPPSHIQSVGMPHSDTCESVEDHELGWGTGLTGGWKRSWGAWLNDGNGGVACTRTLAYDINVNRWVIG